MMSPLEWAQGGEVHTKFDDNQFRHLSNIMVINAVN
jgi:hypothetical protein